MTATELKSKVLPALLAGTARQPLQKIGDASPLALLSLTGQALRFERPVAPTQFSVEAKAPDDRRILPDRIRKPMIWLLRNRRSTEDVELALAWSFARLKLRPHPFDLPRMSGFVKAHAEHLGATAEVWASGEGAAEQHRLIDFFSTTDLDETNWTTAPPALRQTFIMNLRRKDSVAGLELVRSVWSQEDAEIRLRLLGALAAELQPTDKDFLEGLQKDRAPRVRDLARRLLGRLPGVTGWHPALSACMERIEKIESGIFRKHTVLKLQLPATVKEHQAKGWIRETFAEVSFEELARGLQISETDLVEAAAKDEGLLLALALLATADRRLDLLEQIVKRLLDAWEQMSQCGPMQLDTMTSSECLRWAEILVQPYGAKPPFLIAGWSWMHRALRGPVPGTLIEAVLRSSEWRDKLQEMKGPEWMDLLAACCPGELRARLRVLLEMIEPAQTVSALALLDILDAMEKG
ncbi:DUF5691 domain-containing protein [Granulicella aggregans]|uniref:DUF5691 domain-containing protein n=1 Tax=Granulicella aggregans TaxID=474949 RepID=UPI0021E083CE|nr:DUF5691 domain-containing protein [Granulicella aggregans]